MRPSSVPAAHADAGPGGALRRDPPSTISTLQELLQSSRTVSLPANVPVLHWTVDEQQAGSSVEFRGVVSFLLDGVPHSMMGGWRPSKITAKRDAAERVLGLLVDHWGEAPPANHPPSAANLSDDATDDFQALLDFCADYPATASTPLSVSDEWGNAACQATICVHVFGTPHSFVGQHCATRDEAVLDTARRVLWYLQAPGYSDLYEADRDHAQSIWLAVPAPDVDWKRDGEADEAGPKASAQELVRRRQERTRRPHQRRWANLQRRVRAAGLGGTVGLECEVLRVRGDSDRELVQAVARLGPEQIFRSDLAGTEYDARLDLCIQVEHYLHGVGGVGARGWRA